MFEVLVNQFHTMSLGQELYTICFTAFMLGGALCCLLRSDQLPELKPLLEPKPLPEPKPLAKPRRSIRRKSVRVAPLPPALRRAVVVPRLRALPPLPREHRAHA
jgi:hypothetical protein